jgi:signal transduction histidine kinase
MEINTCFLTTSDYHSIAYYSHLVPLFLVFLVSALVVFRSHYSLLSRSFACFALFFCLWLLGDVIVWTSSNYHLVSFVWAPLDYLNILFYLFGAYFFLVLLKEKDLTLFSKILLFAPALPAWWITLTNNSISSFNQPVCEAHNNELLSQYKLWVEICVILLVIVAGIIGWHKNINRRWQNATVAIALILFFDVFGLTEYISSQTGIYEINLYSLFVLPIFVFLIIYSITNLEIFKIKLLGFQLLAYALVIMVGSQFFFLEGSTSKALAVVTFLLSFGFGILLVRTGKREVEARGKVESLVSELEKSNEHLKELDRQKDELLSIVSHQLATPITSVKWYLEMLQDGDVGELEDDQKKHVHSMQAIATDLTDLVGMILDVSRIQLGRMRIDKQSLDLAEFFKEIIETVEPKAIEKHINFVKNLPASFPPADLDKRYTRMTIENLLTNAIKYTPEKGDVTIDVQIKGNKLLCTVKDSGCGIPKAEQDKIFGKLFRASNVRNSVDGNGFGLYVAKGAVEAQGGSIRFDSTEGKGTTFYVELPLS